MTQRHFLKLPSDKDTTTRTSTLPNKAGSVFTTTRVVKIATAYGQYGALGTQAFVGPSTSKHEKSSDDESSSVGHCSETKEFDENDDDSELSCTPLCSRPCQQHGASSSPGEDSDDAPLIEPAIVDTNEGPVADREEARQDRVIHQAAGKIREYVSLLTNPTDAGDYQWDGVTVSRSEIERRIVRLGTFRIQPQR